MALIKNNGLVQEPWHMINEGDALQPGYNLVDMVYWQANKAALIAHHAAIGLRVAGDEDVQLIAADLQYFSLIAINFPTFADGRGYSLANTLREQYGYSHELRAVGDILPDQALYLTRVGFDVLDLPNKASANLALQKLRAFSGFYQPTAV
ncbi:MAG: DUF934 domain-containing protein [Cycloclasticus sp.]